MTKLVRVVLILAITFCSFSAVARADLITSSPDLPPLSGHYVTPAEAHQLYQQGSLSVDVSNINHYGFLATFPPPLNISDSTTHQFGSTLDGVLSVNAGPLIPFSGSALVTVDVTKVGGPNGSPLGTFLTEMLQLDITGLPGGALIRESPTLPSTGQTTIDDAGGGLFRITSFFDIFTELSLDGGQTWIPSTGPGRVDLVPEPGSLVLLLIGGIGLAGYVRRRRQLASSIPLSN